MDKYGFGQSLLFEDSGIRNLTINILVYDAIIGFFGCWMGVVEGIRDMAWLLACSLAGRWSPAGISDHDIQLFAVAGAAGSPRAGVFRIAGFIGRAGWRRSKACMPVFSSQLTVWTP